MVGLRQVPAYSFDEGFVGLCNNVFNMPCPRKVAGHSNTKVRDGGNPLKLSIANTVHVVPVVSSSG